MASHVHGVGAGGARPTSILTRLTLGLGALHALLSRHWFWSVASTAMLQAGLAWHSAQHAAVVVMELTFSISLPSQSVLAVVWHTPVAPAPALAPGACCAQPLMGPSTASVRTLSSLSGSTPLALRSSTAPSAAVRRASARDASV